MSKLVRLSDCKEIRYINPANLETGEKATQGLINRYLSQGFKLIKTEKHWDEHRGQHYEVFVMGRV